MKRFPNGGIIDAVDDLATVAAAIGDPLRVRILDLLAAGRKGACCSPPNPDEPDGVCACDIAPSLGGLAPSKLAYHLGRLRAAGLVTEKRRGKWVYYSVDEDAVGALSAAVSRRWVRAEPDGQSAASRRQRRAGGTARR